MAREMRRGAEVGKGRCPKDQKKGKGDAKWSRSKARAKREKKKEKEVADK